MSLRKRVGKPSVTGNANSPSTVKGVPESSNPGVDQLSQGVAGIDLDSAQDVDWEVYAKENNNVVPSPAIPPPLQHGWNWASRVGSALSKSWEDGPSRDGDPNDIEDDKDEDDESGDMDDDDDELLSDDFDSDTGQKSHETRKNDKWFKSFFTILDNLSVEEMNEPVRQWHCPACQGGPSAIDWFRGLQPLITHAKTKESKRVKIHREFAMLLDEELQMREDREIVWPPMVIIMNTRLEQNENEKWIGMGNQELLECFRELLECFGSYAAVKARHSYGPQGHRGMSVLIFEKSAIGYLEADRLDKHFREQKIDRDAWDHRPVIFLPGGGGKRKLYGYMAKKEDLDIFNQHFQGLVRLKFEMSSFEEMVVSQIKQMSQDIHLLLYYQKRAAKERRHSKALNMSLGIMSKKLCKFFDIMFEKLHKFFGFFGIMFEKLRKIMEENRIVRQRTKRQHEQNREEVPLDEYVLFMRLKKSNRDLISSAAAQGLR